jgi:hypothetical protein
MQTYALENDQIQNVVFEKLKIDNNPHPLPNSMGKSVGRNQSLLSGSNLFNTTQSTNISNNNSINHGKSASF